MDITQFHAAFFEESREGLDAMESGLLGLEHAAGDMDAINVVFRAAHSIKGGAATFGFTAVTDLTHLLETLLDEARGGKRTLDGGAIGALLQAVDVLRGLLAVYEQGGADIDGRIDHAALAPVSTGCWQEPLALRPSRPRTPHQPRRRVGTGGSGSARIRRCS